MNFTDKEIKESLKDDLKPIRLRDEVKSRIRLEIRNEIKGKKSPYGRIIDKLKMFWNHEFEVNLSYTLAALILVVVIPLGVVKKEEQTLESKKITVFEGRADISTGGGGK